MDPDVTAPSVFMLNLVLDLSINMQQTTSGVNIFRCIFLVAGKVLWNFEYLSNFSWAVDNFTKYLNYIFPNI